MNARGIYTVKKWDEKAYDEMSQDARLSKASVEYQIKGEMEGKAIVEYLMFYSHFASDDQHNSAAIYTGLIRFDGSLKGRQGSFVLHDDGTFNAGTASSVLQVLPGSGTGDLQGITGTGNYRADKDGYLIELNYELP